MLLKTEVTKLEANVSHSYNGNDDDSVERQLAAKVDSDGSDL